jgi:hypothetical protein
MLLKGAHDHVAALLSLAHSGNPLAALDRVLERPPAVVKTLL